MYQGKRIAVIVAAAGSGSRMSGEKPKQYLEIGGEMILYRSLRAFAYHPYVDDIFVVVREDDMDYCKAQIKDYWQVPEVRAILSGGEERQDSVANALAVVRQYWLAFSGAEPGTPLLPNQGEKDLILIHDAARPFVTEEVISRLIEGAAKYGAAVPGVPVKDTMKYVGGQFLEETLDRSRMFSIQTPQGFEAGLLSAAYGKALEDNFRGTDDAALVEHLGQPVCLVPGEYSNIKITTDEDLILGGAIVDVQMKKGQTGPKEPAPDPRRLRVGNGFDVHALVAGRKLILGGVEIPFEKGLEGHSDADVLTHAVMDSLLGACGLGDIGLHFPDSDPAYQGISSLKLLKSTMGMIRTSGYRPVNVDVTLVGERPKIRPFVAEIRSNLAAVMELDEAEVNIKGTTTEKMGFCGRGEGLAVQATALCLKER